MHNAQVPIVGFVASSGTGKTTLLTKLIPILKKKGLRVGLIKHSHHDFDIDKPEKDSYRLRQAGASPVMLVSRYRRAIITEFDHEAEPDLDEQLKFLDQTELDLILIEGFKEEKFPKIELYRVSLSQPWLYLSDPEIIAIAGDEPVSAPDEIVKLDINQPDMIAGFIMNRMFVKKC
ncbi:MAG: molybdopterin-guanine dinucleotide biosynthesis protein B [Gammaproteobacteria bacterium]